MSSNDKDFRFMATNDLVIFFSFEVRFKAWILFSLS